MCYISQGMLDRNSQKVSTKKEEDLISDNNHSNNSISNSTLCIIDKCPNRGANLIATTDDSENYSQYLVCHRHYHELMTGYVVLQKDNSSIAWQSV
jgi:hypothetical protein